MLCRRVVNVIVMVTSSPSGLPVQSHEAYLATCMPGELSGGALFAGQAHFQFQERVGHG